jgi:hypothetical protein
MLGAIAVVRRLSIVYDPKYNIKCAEANSKQRHRNHFPCYTKIGSALRCVSFVYGLSLHEEPVEFFLPCGPKSLVIARPLFKNLQLQYTLLLF